MLELLKNAISKVFSTIKDIAILLETASYELENLIGNSNKVQDDVFIQTCSSEQLTSFEKLCNLTRREGLTVDQRRQDVLITFASNVPYTLPKLKQFLNTVVGVGAWALTIDYKNYKLYIRLLKSEEFNIDSLLRGLREMLPCHIAYDINSDIYITNSNTGFYTGGYLVNTITYDLMEG